MQLQQSYTTNGLKEMASWAAEELKKPYAALPDAEQEKDRAVVRVAQSALNAVGLGTPDTQGQEGSVSSAAKKQQLG